MENNVQNVAADAAQNTAMQQVVNPANVADAAVADAPAEAVAVEQPKTLLEIAQSGQKGFKSQCEKFGKILTSDSLATLAKTVQARIDELPTYEANLKALLVEIHQKQAAEKAEEIKAILADLTPEQLAAYLPKAS